MRTKYKRFFRKATSSLLAMAMTLSLFAGIGAFGPGVAYAAGSTISTQAELEQAAQTGGTYTIDGTVYLTHMVTVTADLTLNGGSIVVAEKGHNFTIYSTEVSGKDECMIYVDGGDLTLNNVTVNAQSQTQCINVAGNDTLTLTGATITSRAVTDAVNAAIEQYNAIKGGA